MILFFVKLGEPNELEHINNTKNSLVDHKIG